jgi:hypothetical protein
MAIVKLSVGALTHRDCELQQLYRQESCSILSMCAIEQTLPARQVGFNG